MKAGQRKVVVEWIGRVPVWGEMVRTLRERAAAAGIEAEHGLGRLRVERRLGGVGGRFRVTWITQEKNEHEDCETH